MMKAQNLAADQTFLASLYEHTRYAFQPIVNAHTGTIYGYEALLRGHRDMGLETIQDVFDTAFSLGVLHQADLYLRELALSMFSKLHKAATKRLFYNLDGRCFESPDYHPEGTRGILKKYKIPASAFCLELSERHDNHNAVHVTELLDRYRQQSVRIAIDDYGMGFSQLHMLYEHQPDYLKIDRFFIDGVATDNKKALMISTIVKMAHMLGITVIAEGVENEADFLTCKNMGCDLVQGYLVERPLLDMTQLQEVYDQVQLINEGDRRRKKQKDDLNLVREHVEKLPTVRESESMEKVLEIFGGKADLSLLPVIDHSGYPRGIIQEKDLKSIIYNRFGHALLTNKALGNPQDRFIRKCPIAEVSSSIDEILEIYAQARNPEGILVVDEFRYLGFLSAQSLLHMVYEKRLEQARDQNPLTKLPGNHSISDHVAACLAAPKPESNIFVYFDFNDFKPFNDYYGFRQGDRAILLFAEIMQRHLTDPGIFLGHVGGDDFFAAFAQTDLEEVRRRVQGVLNSFANDIESFYEATDRERGYIETTGRDGETRQFPMLSCAAALIALPPVADALDHDRLVKAIAVLKKRAKAAPEKIAMELMTPRDH
ncbi:GGDEF domain-containing protein [Aestuariispira insulae]|uniref:Diguanylate cyclase/phosphodiesterase n=1 Tax=Aestuariispira insulae TaxID=1461337 RepID=A0A3D9HRY1_9PROT|nr:GGDEF domain-containing protein [Aestuariispira insulae]RED52165.1 diguanylate cyclase/phosphodiesterase [Aestuariispira insulae]